MSQYDYNIKSIGTSGENNNLSAFINHPAILEGMRLAAQKRASDGLPPAVETLTLPKPRKQSSSFIKIWSNLIWRSHRARRYKSAAIMYFIARSLDPGGSGWISKGDLIGYLDGAGVHRRTQRRRIQYAKELELFIEVRSKRDNKPAYKIANLAAAAAALMVDRIGSPVGINADILTGGNWQAYTWAAYKKQRADKPTSQKVEALLTGVSPKTQWAYNKTAEKNPITSQEIPLVRQVKNIRILEEGHNRSDKRRLANGINERGIHTYVNSRGELVQRLPNTVKVSMRHFEPCNPGRSKKAQNKLNNIDSSRSRREQYNLKLFWTPILDKEGKRIRRHLSNFPAWELPKEVYIYGGALKHVRDCYKWQAIPQEAFI